MKIVATILVAVFVVVAGAPFASSAHEITATMTSTSVVIPISPARDIG